MDTPKGRGVFATKTIPAGVTIDISPVLIFETCESQATILEHYTYTWPAEGDILENSDQRTLSNVSSSSQEGVKRSRQALALGLGSMFNHNRTPNVAWERNIPTLSIRYFTLRQISEGEELCISYGPKLWFSDADGPEEHEVPTDTEGDVLSCGVDIFN